MHKSVCLVPIVAGGINVLFFENDVGRTVTVNDEKFKCMITNYFYVEDVWF